MFSIFGVRGKEGMTKLFLPIHTAKQAINKLFVRQFSLLLALLLLVAISNNIQAQVKPNGSTCDLTQISNALTPTSQYLGNSGDSCNLYYLLPANLTADSAENWAVSVGGHLTSIHSQAENDSIVSWLNAAGVTGSVWIGLNDKTTEGTFVWTDNSDTTFKNWKTGRPNGVGASDDCVQLFVNGTDSNKWNDTSCALTLPSVIKISLCMNTTTTTDTVCSSSESKNYVTVAGGSPNYKYLWVNADTTDTMRVNPTLTGYFHVTVTDRYACQAKDSSFIQVDSVPLFTIGYDTNVCSGDTVTSRADKIVAGYTYSWHDNSTASFYKTDSTDTISLTATDARGCSATSTRVITWALHPTVNVGADTTVCAKSLFQILGDFNFTDHRWISHNDTVITRAVLADSNGAYYYYGIDTNGCPGYDTINVSWDTIPVINLGNDTSICQFDTITLSVPSGFKSISWSTGDTIETTKASTPQAYNVQVIDSNGCNGSDVIIVRNDSLPDAKVLRNGLAGDTSICTLDSVFLHNISSLDSMEYSWNGGAYTKGYDTLVVKSAGKYVLTVRDTNTCYSKDSLTVSLDSLPIVGLRSDTTICKGDSILLKVNSDTNYHHFWGGVNLGKTDTMWVSKDSTYVVQLIDKNTTCSSTDSIVIGNDTLPIINLGVDTGFCTNDTVLLDAGANYLKYKWNTGPNDTTRTLKAYAKGSYSVSVIDQNLCKGQDSRFVDKFVLPIPNLGPDKKFCAGTPVNETLDPGAGYNYYKWGHGPQGDSTTARRVIVNAQGSYNVVVTDSNGCKGSDTISINASFLPSVDLGPDTSFCSGDKFNFLINAGPGFVKYEWFNAIGGAPVLLPTTGQLLLVQDTAALVVCRITDNNGCQNLDTLRIRELSRPIVNFNISKYCESGKRFFTETVDADPAGLYQKYKWSTGDTTRQITVTEGGDYLVTVTDASSCTTVGKKQVIEIPRPNIDWTADSLLCEGTTVKLDAQRQGYIHYYWFKVFDVAGKPDSMMNPMLPAPADTIVDTTVTSMDITSPGKYKVYTRYFEAPYCYDSAFAEIRADIYPKINFGIRNPDTNLCIGETLLLDPKFSGSSSKVISYLWQDNSTDTILLAKKTGLYTLSLTNDCGSDIDEVYATFEDCSNVYIPNAFSPNGDGDNELWKIVSLEDFLEFNLQIFDRTGSVVWETNNADVAWDGTHIRSGEPLPIGVYVYKISYRSKYEYIEGVNSAPTRDLNGAINLIR